MKPARRVEGVVASLGPDRPRRGHGRARNDGPSLVHAIEDGVVSGAVAETTPVARFAVARAAGRIDERWRVDQLQRRVVGRLDPERLDVWTPIEFVRVDQIPRQEHAVGTEWMLRTVVVDARIGGDDQADALAHPTDRTAATVRSTRIPASSSVRMNGGPSMTRSPFLPPTWPVDE